MAGKGGYQRPERPAAVSGPGAMSQRTDGKPSMDNPRQAARYLQGEKYGESKALNELATGAPLAGSNTPGQTPPPESMPSMPMPTPLGAPTERPFEPVTAGAPFGSGPNLLPFDMEAEKLAKSERLRAAAMLGIFQNIAEGPHSTESARQMVRYLKSVL